MLTLQLLFMLHKGFQPQQFSIAVHTKTQKTRNVYGIQFSAYKKYFLFLLFSCNSCLNLSFHGYIRLYSICTWAQSFPVHMENTVHGGEISSQCHYTHNPLIYLLSFTFRPAGWSTDLYRIVCKSKYCMVRWE